MLPLSLFSLSILALDTFPLLNLFFNRGRSPQFSLSPSRGRHTSFTILPGYSVLLFIATSEDTVQNWLERCSSTRFGTVIDWPNCRATQPSVPPSFLRFFDRLLVLPEHPCPPFNFVKMESHKKRLQRIEKIAIESPDRIARCHLQIPSNLKEINCKLNDCRSYRKNRQNSR